MMDVETRHEQTARKGEEERQSSEQDQLGVAVKQRDEHVVHPIAGGKHSRNHLDGRSLEAGAIVLHQVTQADAHHGAHQHIQGEMFPLRHPTPRHADGPGNAIPRERGEEDGSQQMDELAPTEPENEVEGSL